MNPAAGRNLIQKVVPRVGDRDRLVRAARILFGFPADLPAGQSFKYRVRYEEERLGPASSTPLPALMLVLLRESLAF